MCALKHPSIKTFTGIMGGKIQDVGLLLMLEADIQLERNLSNVGDFNASGKS